VLVEQDPAGRRRKQPAEKVEQRRFADTVLAGEHECASRREGELCLDEHPELPVSKGGGVELETKTH
jgi:hypothetical protein